MREFILVEGKKKSGFAPDFPLRFEDFPYSVFRFGKRQAFLLLLMMRTAATPMIPKIPTAAYGAFFSFTPVSMIPFFELSYEVFSDAPDIVPETSSS